MNRWLQRLIEWILLGQPLEDVFVEDSDIYTLNIDDVAILVSIVGKAAPLLDGITNPEVRERIELCRYMYLRDKSGQPTSIRVVVDEEQ